MERVIASLPLPACIVDADLVIVEWNRSLAEYSAIEISAAKGKSLSDVLPYVHEQHIHDRLAIVLRGGPPAVFSARLHPAFIDSRTASGEARIFETHVARVQLERRDDVGLILTFIDQTEVYGTLRRVSDLRKQADKEIERRKLTESRLQISEEILFTLFQSIPNPSFIWRIEHDNVFLDECNQEARELSASHGPRSLHDWLSDLLGDYDSVLDRVRQCHHTKKAAGEEVVHKEDGKSTWYQVDLVPIPPEMVMMQVMNITARKQQEQLQIDSNRMQVANLMAATIAHEFNNPLAIIKMTMDLLRLRLQNPAELEGDLQKIERQVARMKALSKQLLELQEVEEIDYAAGMKILNIGNPVTNDPAKP